MLTIGLSLNDSFLVADADARRRVLDRAVRSGLTHVTVGDHISFHGGTGFDGLISATSLLSSSDEVHVIIGVYLLALRHPMLAARQLSTLSQLAPGRLTLGVGVGGEDRSEMSNSGVDPATRGRRLNEALTLLRQLSTGEAVTHAGEFFTLEEARILPAPVPRVPLVIGGKGDVAVRRTAEFGDGWLGIFCSARRFAETRTRILEVSAERGREGPSWFGVNVWCGVDRDARRARQHVASRMESLYNVPYEKFEHLAPAGTPAQVAEWLMPFVEAGAQYVTLVPAAGSNEAAIDAVAEVRGRLLATASPVLV